MATHRKTDLVVDAVTIAVHRRGSKVLGVIHHSHRGARTPLTSSSGDSANTVLSRHRQCCGLL
jgi:hypothetical protein